MPFQKGHTLSKGKGRPVGSQSLTENLRMYLVRKNEVDPNSRTYRECLIDKLVSKAVGGDTVAIKEVFDRVDGKPPQIIQGDAAKPLTVTLQWGSKPEWVK